ncbi:MAG: hypothetical protein MJ052_06020, partial [Sphaerochaetaceae bacterium]|nr:hypothetical protein [Sphaerochaetaceae bacterium]
SGIDDRLLSESAVCLVRRKKINLTALISELEKNQCWDRFFQHVIFALYEDFRMGMLPEEQVAELSRDITEAVSKGKAFNQMKRLTFDYVFFKVREVLG